jgi:hypothetical protein
MSTSDTPTNKKGFFNKYSRWTYWFVVFLIIELIIILSVLYGYIFPKNQQLKDSLHDCKSHYTRLYGICQSGCKTDKSRCISECNNNLQCIIDCDKKYDNCPYLCNEEVLDKYDDCNDKAIYLWSQ